MADRLEAWSARLQALHAALAGGDPTALAQIWDLLWRPLCRRLRRQFPLAVDDDIIDAATDAIRVYAERPQVYDAARHVPLDVWMHGIAWRMLRDRLRGGGRRSARETEAAPFLYMHRDQTGDDLVSRVALREVRSALLEVCTRSERLAMADWLARDDVSVIAKRFGLSHLPRAQRVRWGEMFLGRLIKRLRRRFGVEEGSERGGVYAQIAVEKIIEWLTLRSALRRLIHQ